MPEASLREKTAGWLQRRRALSSVHEDADSNQMPAWMTLTMTMTLTSKIDRVPSCSEQHPSAWISIFVECPFYRSSFYHHSSVAGLAYVGLDQHSYSTPGPASAWMGDRLWTGKSLRHRTRHPGLFSLSHPSVDWRNEHLVKAGGVNRHIAWSSRRIVYVADTRSVCNSKVK